MTSLLIFCGDAKLRRTLEQQAQQDLGIKVVGITDDHRSFVRLADRSYPNVVLIFVSYRLCRRDFVRAGRQV
jgi:hypothetical protein